MEEREKEECTSVASYPTESGPSSAPEDYDHILNNGSMEKFGDKLSRYGQIQYC